MDAQQLKMIMAALNLEQGAKDSFGNISNLAAVLGSGISANPDNPQEAALARALQGFSATSALGVPGAIAGTVGGAALGFAEGQAKLAEEQRLQDNKIKNDTYNRIVSFEGGMYGEGGMIELEESIFDDIENIFTPVQLEEYEGNKEIIYTADGHLHDTHANESHEDMDEKKATDVVAPGAYIIPSRASLSEDDVEKAFGYGVDQYDENGISYNLSELSLSSEFNIDAGDIFSVAAAKIRKKAPVKNKKVGQSFIDDLTDYENLQTRKLPMNLLVSLNEARINGGDVGIEPVEATGVYKEGGIILHKKVPGMEDGGRTTLLSKDGYRYEFNAGPPEMYYKVDENTNNVIATSSTGFPELGSVPVSSGLSGIADIAASSGSVGSGGVSGGGSVGSGGVSGGASVGSNSQGTSPFNSELQRYLNEVLPELMSDADDTLEGQLMRSEQNRRKGKASNASSLFAGLVGNSLQDTTEDAPLIRPFYTPITTASQLKSQTDSILKNSAESIKAIGSGRRTQEVAALQSQIAGRSADAAGGNASRVFDANIAAETANNRAEVEAANANVASTTQARNLERGNRNAIISSNAQNTERMFANNRFDDNSALAREEDIRNAYSERSAEIADMRERLILAGMSNEQALRFIAEEKGLTESEVRDFIIEYNRSEQDRLEKESS